MRPDKMRIRRVVWLSLVLGLVVFALSGCFLLGPQVVIPTLAPNASPVVNVIKTDTLEPTVTVEKAASDGKTIESKPSATKQSASATPSSTPTATKEPSTATPTVTPKPATATPTPQPPCPQQVDDRLLAAYNAAGGRARLGCAKTSAVEEQWGYQKYEHGWMFWRGPKTTIYAGKADGAYSIHADEWNSSLPERACDYPAPSGMMQPKRGFGLVWCKNDDLRAAIGFASAEEFPAQALVQEFDNGVIVAQASGNTRVFYSDNTWKDLGVLP
ncbi:MAG: hypothetical protein ACYCZF_02010 [Anaerolineae bacterium]